MKAPTLLLWISIGHPSKVQDGVSPRLLSDSTTLLKNSQQQGIHLAQPGPKQLSRGSDGSGGPGGSDGLGGPGSDGSGGHGKSDGSGGRFSTCQPSSTICQPCRPLHILGQHAPATPRLAPRYIHLWLTHPAALLLRPEHGPQRLLVEALEEHRHGRCGARAAAAARHLGLPSPRPRDAERVEGKSQGQCPKSRSYQGMC